MNALACTYALAPRKNATKSGQSSCCRAVSSGAAAAKLPTADAERIALQCTAANDGAVDRCLLLRKRPTQLINHVQASRCAMYTAFFVLQCCNILCNLSHPPAVSDYRCPG